MTWWSSSARDGSPNRCGAPPTVGAPTCYDGLGREAVEENLAALAPCGHWVSVGQSSGPLDPVLPERLAESSLTWSRPVVFHYIARRDALTEVAERTFEALRRGVLRGEIRHRYPLADASLAHRALEARRTVGSVVLLP